MRSKALHRADLTSVDGHKSYKLPISLPASLDSPPDCGQLATGGSFPKWFRITCSFKANSTHIIVSKPCHSYYDIDGSIKGENDQAKFPAQIPNGPGFAGCFGDVGEQYLWTGNEQVIDWDYFSVGDKKGKQSTTMILYKMELYNEEVNIKSL